MVKNEIESFVGSKTSTRTLNAVKFKTQRDAFFQRVKVLESEPELIAKIFDYSSIKPIDKY